MARFTNAWPSLLSAALLLLAFPPFNLGFLVFVALAPWFAALKGKTGKEGFKSGYSFGLLFFAGQFVWMYMFVERWTKSPIMGLIPAVACTIVGSLYFATTGWMISIALRRNWLWAIPIFWAGMEVFRSFIPGLAFPWGLVHTPLYPYAGLIQLAHFGTAYLVSAWAILANVTATIMLLKMDGTKIRPYAMTFLVLGVASWVRYSTPMEGSGKQILIAQPGVDLAFGDPATEEERIQVALVEVFARADMNEKADLVVLPEGLINNRAVWPPTLGIEMPNTAPVVMGGQRSEGKITYQSAYGYDGKWSYADKRRLVIFGEYVPFRNQVGFLQSFSLPSGDLSPSDKTVALNVGGMTVGPMLCFEALFPDVAHDQANNGAQILLTMSVDDWYMNSPAPEQLMAGSVFRAVEAGVPLARAATTGISMCVDARGNILKMAPTGGMRFIQQELVVPEKPDYIPASWYAVWVFIASLLAIPIADRVIRSKSESA